MIRRFRRPSAPRKIGAAAVALGLLAGCASPAPVAVRHPEYRPAEIRRPAVVLQVSLDQGGLGQGAFTSREREILPDRIEIGVIDGLNTRGIFPVDLTLIAHRAWRGTSISLDRIDRTLALARARQLGADTLLIVDMHLGRSDVVYCRGSRRPFRARSTMLTVSLEVLRVGDGTRLLLESPAGAEPLTDVETDCVPQREVRRLSAQELIDAGIARGLGRLTSP